uniref:Uncharacterized protein n=1 Tax=Varanus komodoensis TaxID=61221 RepID=A0A8D2Q7Q2_VARKO
MPGKDLFGQLVPIIGGFQAFWLKNKTKQDPASLKFAHLALKKQNPLFCLTLATERYRKLSNDIFRKPTNNGNKDY